MKFVPSYIFLTKGMGRHKEKLTSFELALRAARIASFNLVSVSSIFPPNCKLISKTKGIEKLDHGEIVYTVLSRNSTDEPHRLVGSSIGIAVPTDRARYGYLSEHHSYGLKQKIVGDYAEDLAATMLANTLGIEIDVDKAWDERKEHWKIADGIVRTTNITQTAVGKEKLWTSVVAAAVFCD
ncbi:MAG: arginine decarboxylase, pyruvoyl-dependent [Candidatus Latescibacterota bacterium]